NTSGRQTVAVPRSATRREVLVRVCQPERRVAVARAGPDIDSTGTAVASGPSDPGGVVLQQPHWEGCLPFARSAIARAEVRLAAGAHFLAGLSQRKAAGEELDGHAATGG